MEIKTCINLSTAPRFMISQCKRTFSNMIGKSHYNLVNAHNVLCTYMLRRFALLFAGSVPFNLLFPRNLVMKETIHASIQKGECWDYTVQLNKWGILQVRERTQIEKGVRNLPCYIVEAQIPGKIYNTVTWTDTTVTISHGCENRDI
jgi:hypothetical protein